MTPELEKRVRHLEIVVERRIEGLLQGEHRGLLPGAGREAGDARPYAPGDDVRRIDWNVTARAQRPYVRETIADHELDTTLVVDCSGSMEFGTADAEKRVVAISAAAVYGFLASGAGNRVGAALATGTGLRWIQARGGRSHLYRILGEAERLSTRGGRVDLPAALRSVAGVRRRRGLVVVTSDFHDPGDWDRSLRTLVARNQVVAIEVADPREETLPDAGVMRMEDAETGRQLEVDTTDPRLRAAFASSAAARRAEVARRVRLAGAQHIRLSTAGDWVGELVKAVLVRRRLASAAGRAG